MNQVNQLGHNGRRSHIHSNAVVSCRRITSLELNNLDRLAPVPQSDRSLPLVVSEQMSQAADVEQAGLHYRILGSSPQFPVDTFQIPDVVRQAGGRQVKEPFSGKWIESIHFASGTENDIAKAMCFLMLQLWVAFQPGLGWDLNDHLSLDRGLTRQDITQADFVPLQQGSRLRSDVTTLNDDPAFTAKPIATTDAVDIHPPDLCCIFYCCPFFYKDGYIVREESDLTRSHNRNGPPFLSP